MTQYIYITGSFLALFLGVLVISKKRKKPHDYILSIWLFLISCHVVVYILQESADISLEGLIRINAAFPLLQGVFLYLYTLLLLQKGTLKPILIFHFLPFLVFAFSFYVFGEQILNILIISIIISGIVYIILTMKLLGSFGSFFNRNDNWLKLLTAGLGLVWILFIIIGVLNHLFDYVMIEHHYIFLSVSIFVFCIGYFGLKEGHILQAPRTKGIYNSSPLGTIDFIRIEKRLMELQQDKLFILNPDLTISNLAAEMNIPSHHLSQYFSAAKNTTYNYYINDYRIKEFISRIQDNEHVSLSIFGIAYDCGFKSKATFNRAFKKHTGLTPSEYIKSVK